MTFEKRLRLLLSDGFFAAQIPPSFNSVSFSRHHKVFGASWDAIKAGKCTEETTFERYSVARVGHNRRPIAITNPVAFYFLARLIAKEWSSLSRLMRRSRLSLSFPELGVEGSRAISITPIKQLNEERLLRSAGARYLLVSDISQFFPSIYTHAIAWAVEGKQIAKSKAARRDNTPLGNQLDELVRFTQSNQTVGIPIGPDTSHILAELIGVAIDEELRKKLGGWPKGYRHVDDYCLCFNTENEAAQAYAKLSEALAVFELKVNIQKTKIVRVSDFQYDSWVHQFDSFVFSTAKVSQRRDLHRFFDLAFSLAQRFDDENVMQYALRRVETEIVKSKNWDVFAAYLMRCMDAFPNTIPTCVSIIDTYNRYFKATSFDPEAWHAFVSNQVTLNAPIERHSEVAWLLWLALRLRLRLERKAVKVLEQMQKSVCLLLALALESEGLLRAKLARNRLPAHTNREDLFGSNWLLVYEGAIQGWLKPALPVVQSEKYFKELAQNNVRFFDLSREPEPVFKLKGEGINPEVSAYVFDSDEDVYEYFEFSESDEDYLGRRLRKDDDDGAGGVPILPRSGINDIGNADWDDLPW
ncbi:RNA-directed DNA polymerase [Burkholderia cenocepacia]|uniref:RNA-directed DNA polymerase n=1 Tax=Burkholderia cenocepacia TaxID=95486 RepID=UPI001CF5FD2A|nr:RNA-directed DNA polymerase [Burkholderia cenocepacia]MCA8010214.1 RNA-directed DNA polymerase [Burkholderia cenocepacia]